MPLSTVNFRLRIALPLAGFRQPGVRAVWQQGLAAVVGGLLALPLLAAEPAAGRQDELRHIVIQDCGSCHGLKLRGGLGSPLLPPDLAGKPAEGLLATVLYGRPGTAMPPFNSLLNEAEARWIVDQLQRGRIVKPE